MKDYYLVYRVESCNFCDDAVNLLKEKEEPFVIMDMTSNPEIVQEVKKQNKMTTVPIVQFVCEKMCHGKMIPSPSQCSWVVMTNWSNILRSQKRRRNEKVLIF